MRQDQAWWVYELEPSWTYTNWAGPFPDEDSAKMAAEMLGEGWTHRDGGILIRHRLALKSLRAWKKRNK